MIGRRSGCSGVGTWRRTFADAEVTPFEKFPINGYDVDDPGVDFANWTLTVVGR